MATTPKGDAEEVRRMVVRDLARKVAGLRPGAGGTTQVASRRRPLSVRQIPQAEVPSLSKLVMRR